MKRKKNLNNNKKLEEQDAKHNDNENDVKIGDIIYVYLSINIIYFYIFGIHSINLSVS